MLHQESQHTEWKETWRDDYLRWVCGFANAQGGRLLLGVNDKGQVVGLPDAAKLLEDLPNKVRDLLGVVVAVNLLTENGLPYLELVVQAYPTTPSATGATTTCAAAARCKRSKVRRWIAFCWAARVAPGTVCHCRSSVWPTCRPRPWRGFANWRSAVGVPEPVLRYAPNDMWMEFAFDPAYLKALKGGQKQAEQVKAEVTPEVGRMLYSINGEMSRVELMDALGLKDEKHFRTHYQQAALAAGVLEMTVPDKPKSRLQKYKLTALGRQWLNKDTL